MEALNSLAVLLGGSLGSGINLYMTTAGLGIAHRMHLLALPGEMDALAHPLVIAAAIGLYGIEFVADKIPFVDSAWDSIHTFIRPLGGAAMGYMAMANVGPVGQIPMALLTGSIAMDSHLTKATTRAAINTSPEPFTNSIASVTEDVSVAGLMYLVIAHPVIASLTVIAFIIFSIWFLRKMFRFIRNIFRPRNPKEIRAESGAMA
ncbi:MAG: DUF4126 domain-containing protein [Candidatus Aceula meridiana]|nr:DUF4126 domain-containing protein [Candidatus Aceula meridiana]